MLLMALRIGIEFTFFLRIYLVRYRKLTISQLSKNCRFLIGLEDFLLVIVSQNEEIKKLQKK